MTAHHNEIDQYAAAWLRDLIVAVNHAGFNVERLAGAGWTPITPEPFATRAAAEAHLATLDRSSDELRIYEALS